MKIYIAGKISGLPQIEVERKFATAKEALIAKGYEPISPLDNGCDSLCWFDQMAACFQMLKSCDGIYICCPTGLTQEVRSVSTKPPNTPIKQSFFNNP